MRTERVLFVVDTHIGGEPTRIVLGRIVLGRFPPVNCDNITAISQVILEPEDALKYGFSTRVV